MDNPSPSGTAAVRLLRKGQIVPHLIPVSRSTFNRWLRSGKFPPGFLLSPRIRVWAERTVLEWMRTWGG